jgi:NADPH:quinone reductase-like Zn-dependent oxidoreductase
METQPLTNTAAWLTAAQAKLEVVAAPYTRPSENEIVVVNRAVAINPVDWVIQVAGNLAFPWIRFPFVLGSDLAGDVVEIGSGITRFKVGDRVLAHAVGTDPKRNSAAEGSFQTYTVVLEKMAAPIPSDLSYDRATVLPLGISTAACGLFQKDHLALDYPSAVAKPNGKTLLVWGGSTSVGSNAIQLAVAAGYEVIATASPRNFDYVRKLGASRAFDYNDDNVVPKLIDAFAGKTLAGAIAIGRTSARACVDVVHGCKGRKFVSIATYPISFDNVGDRPINGLQRLAIVRPFLWFSVTNWLKCRARGIRTQMIFGSSLAENDVGDLIYARFLPRALAEGRYVTAPRPSVIGTGLESVQAGLDLQRKGVSASKVVVSLPGA